MLFNGQLALVLEKIRGHCLSAIVCQSNVLMYWKVSMILDILSDIWYLHEQTPPIVHVDLKPTNLMVEIRVADVGCNLVPRLKLLYFGFKDTW